MKADHVTDPMKSGFGICRWACLLLTVALLCGLVSGCRTMGMGRRAAVLLECDPQINEGLILSVDLIWADERGQKEILNIGPDRWFSHDYRWGLTETHLTRLDLRGGGSRQVNLRAPSGAVVLIVFADYGNVTDPNAKRLVIQAGGIVRAQRVHIRVHEDKLEQVHR